MIKNASPHLSWRRSRYGFVVFNLFSLVVAWFVLRLVLLMLFRSTSLASGDAARVLLTGLQRDLFAGLILSVPLLTWMLFFPERWVMTRWYRLSFLGASFVFWFLQTFLLFVEFFFFDEFKSRYNTVAVDYLWHPGEVVTNIWESYHVGVIVAICLVMAVGWLFVANWCFRDMWERRFRSPTRFLHLAATLLLVAGLAWLLPLKGVKISADRTINEIANNGVLSFAAAATTRHLDYSAFYKTLPKDEAYQRTRRLLAENQTRFVEDGQSIRRQVSGDPSRPRLNVVIFLEESLGSEFWGCLGRSETLTPEMDKLALEEGLLFTNLYACGNRTVRGMEGVLSSIPPLPGDSIVRRDLSDNVETVARVLKRDGYATAFLYGGRGFFDSMRSYAVRNGYEQFIEQKHFSHPTFTTAWGVCDEDLFDRAILEFRQMAKSGRPFFATLLSVSNHQPYTYPPGRIPEDPAKKWRKHAVKYSDYALGKFFRDAKKEAFWTNTIFAVIADHGARVYGSQSIPIKSYEIPLVILGPAAVKAPARVGQLGCSLDVSPTLLGLIGRPYETMFFGRDLLKSQPAEGRAWLNHNRDIGMLTKDRMVVLGLMQGVEFYQGDPKVAEIIPLSRPSEADGELEKDAISIYQVADDLYTHQRFRIDGAPVTSNAPAPQGQTARSNPP
jgi:phosphoglycerol transferase MdoB-like AlkP superfamily enzyme